MKIYSNILNGYFITILWKWRYPADRLKTRKDIGEFNSTINELHITKVSLSPLPEMTEKDFFSYSHERKIDHILDYKTNKKFHNVCLGTRVRLI